MKYEDIIKELKSGVYKPVYFLQGEEGYFLDKISDFIAKNVLGESERDFNQTILYGKDVSMQDIISTAKRYPMMSEYQVVIIKEAQHLSRTIDQLAAYIANPLASTILVFNYKYKKLDKRKKIGKLLAANTVFFTSDKVKEYKLADWIVGFCKSQGLEIKPKASHLLGEYLGNDLSKITNTIEKLKVILEGETVIDEDVIQNNVGISKDFNMFELSNALADKNVYKSNLIVNHFAQNPKNYPFPATLGTLYNYYTKLVKYHFYAPNSSENELARILGVNAYFIKDYRVASRNYTKAKLARIFGYLKDYDLRSKGVGNVSIPDGELLKELVFKILH
jgi:DNA polymerase-3 subunit delta